MLYEGFDFVKRQSQGFIFDLMKVIVLNCSDSLRQSQRVFDEIAVFVLITLDTLTVTIVLVES